MTTDPSRPVGIEIGTTHVRGVRLAAGDRLQIETAVEVPVLRANLASAVARAVTDLRVTPEDHVVVATFAEATLHAVDVSGDRPGDAFGAAGAVSAWQHRSPVLIEGGAHRHLVVTDTPDAQRRSVADALERAGIGRALVEASPVAVARLLRPEPSMVWRADSPVSGWLAVCADGVPLGAVCSPRTEREAPWLRVADADAELVRQIAERPVTAVLGPLAADSSRRMADAPLATGRHLYPPYAPNDVRAAARQCVAVGAALGAMTRSAVVVDPVGAATSSAAAVTAIESPPWLVERLADVVAPTELHQRRRGRRRR